MNPYEAPQTEHAQVDPGEPMVAAEVPTPLWMRIFGIGGPFCAGIAFLAGVEHARDQQVGWAGAYFALATAMMLFAWRWTR